MGLGLLESAPEPCLSREHVFVDVIELTFLQRHNGWTTTTTCSIRFNKSETSTRRRRPKMNEDEDDPAEISARTQSAHGRDNKILSISVSSHTGTLRWALIAPTEVPNFIGNVH